MRRSVALEPPDCHPVSQLSVHSCTDIQQQGFLSPTQHRCAYLISADLSMFGPAVRRCTCEAASIRSSECVRPFHSFSSQVECQTSLPPTCSHDSRFQSPGHRLSAPARNVRAGARMRGHFVLHDKRLLPPEDHHQTRAKIGAARSQRSSPISGRTPPSTPEP